MPFCVTGSLTCAGHLRYGLPFEFHFQNDSGLFLYASLAAFAVLLLSSLLPARRCSDADLSLALKQGEPPLSVRRWNLRNEFVLLQVVLSIVLLTIGALFARSFLHLSATGPGFDVGHTLIATLHPLHGRYTEERRWDLRQQAIRRVEEIPGVVGVTSTGTLPLMGRFRMLHYAARVSPCPPCAKSPQSEWGRSTARR